MPFNVEQVKYCPHGFLSGARTAQFCTVMAACLAQIQKCHGWLCEAGTVLYCHVCLFGTDTKISWLAGQVQYCTIMAACLAQIQKFHGWLGRYSTVLSWLPVWHRYKNVMAGYVRQVQFCTVIAACLAQIQECHVWLRGTGRVLSWLPVWGTYSSILSWLPFWHRYRYRYMLPVSCRYNAAWYLSGVRENYGSLNGSSTELL